MATNASGGLEALAEAIQAGDLRQVQALLVAGTDPNAVLDGGQTPLTLAAQYGHDAILRACIRHGADFLAERSPYGGRPLDVAVEHGREPCALTLLAIGAGACQESLDSSLMWAARTGNSALLRALCAEGANPYQIHRGGHSPLSRAIQASHFETARLIVSRLADLARRRTHLKNALRFFIYQCALEGAAFVLEIAPDIYDEADDLTGESPIEGAAKRGDARLLRFLLARGCCNLEGATSAARRWPEWFQTPLMNAVWAGYFDAVRVLVDAGAKLEARASQEGFTPLMFACVEPRAPDSAEIAGYLLKRGAQLEARSHAGQTPLLLAAQSGNGAVLDTLLRFGANTSARDHEGRGALALASAELPSAMLHRLSGPQSRRF